MSLPVYHAHYWTQGDRFAAEVTDCSADAEQSVVGWVTEDVEDRVDLPAAVRDMIAVELAVEPTSFAVELEAGLPVHLRVGGDTEQCVGWVTDADPLLLAEFLRSVALVVELRADHAGQAAPNTPAGTP